MLTNSSGTAVKSANVTLSTAKGLARQQPWQDVTDPLSVSLSPVTPPHIRFAQCKLRERSGSIGSEMLSAAKHDRAGPCWW